MNGKINVKLLKINIYILQDLINYNQKKIFPKNTENFENPPMKLIT